MPGKFPKLLDRAIGLNPCSERETALMAERFAAFVPRMPWLYAILFINLSGLLVSIPGGIMPMKAPGIALLLILAMRLGYWLRMRRRPPAPELAKRGLRTVFLIAPFFCTAYCAWVLTLYANSTDEHRSHIVLYVSLAAVACSFSLSPLPSAAQLPLLTLAAPMALTLLFDEGGGIAHIGMGLSLATLIYVTLRLIEAQNVTFSRLVHSRLDTECEKHRAETAERRALAERSLARKIADTDALTGLANRRALLSAIDRAQGEGRSIALALLDLDGFKAVNDTFGHPTGDALLVTVSRRLRELVDGTGMAARLGGDEFALLFEGCSEREAQKIVEQAIALIAEPCFHEGRSLLVSACGGIAFPDVDEPDASHAMRMADIALFAAKRGGRGALEIFSSSLEQHVKRRAEIELALRVPGIENEIELAFQPIVDLTTMQVCSFEALARWRHSELGWIAPSEFIPITEQISVVGQITESLLSRAAAEAVRWPESMLLSFNLSAVQLCAEGSAQRMVAIVEEAGLHPSRLQIEVTETALLADFDAARRNLAYLGRRGTRLVLDDFGAGYASISYLREMRFDAIKLDGSLITAATGKQHGNLALLKGVLDLCRAVGLPCIAEHVETEAQVATLRELGCRYGQGYWLARPMSADSARQVAQSALISFAPARALKQWERAGSTLRAG